MLNPAGPVNRVLGLLHLPEPLWFQDPRWSKPGLVLLGLWGIGNAMIIFLAALLDVPRQLYEAADIEGASAVAAVPPRDAADDLAGHLLLAGHRGDLRLPVLHPGLSCVSQPATQASRVSGTPRSRCCSTPIHLYQQGFQYFHMGYASAMAWVLFVIIMACTLVLIRARAGGSTTREGSDSHRHARPPRAAAGARRVRAAAPRAARSPPAPVAAVGRQPLGGHRAVVGVPAAVPVHRPHLADDRPAGAVPQLWPRPFEWSNFREVFHLFPLVRYTLNTVLYAALADHRGRAVVCPGGLRAVAACGGAAARRRSSWCCPP